MKIIVEKFIIQKLSYDSLRSLEDIMGENRPKKFQVQEKISGNNEYAWKKDNTGILISNQTELTSIPKIENVQESLQTIILNGTMTVKFELDDREKEVIKNIDNDKLFEKMSKQLEAIVDVTTGNILNTIKSHGQWNKETPTPTPTSFEISIHDDDSI
ncbi:hypothetical protein [Convivina intestini]|uniref:Uncharacterized protein n=1 Tax=Convivina intestini TaxID=1505726 RepID=A0A2U1D4F8_9LACO|nr:hypothetical protein [Convivina intestini]PVY82566.1 hypothetical protein C7384_1113 [Convivina intestini]CAH1857305.1 hypothetical protein R077811_01469 [Convivina intestini]SDC10303.1 hypothetical protein SAMN05216341_11242 [Leuconostocaceae bacterium R-53105]